MDDRLQIGASPEHDLRMNLRPRHSAFEYPSQDSNSTAYSAPYPLELLQSDTFTPHPPHVDRDVFDDTHNVPASGVSHAHAHAHAHTDAHAFSTSAEPDFSHMDDAQMAAALASYEPCNNCTSTTHTRIPHHHHQPSGRLAGASATLDGHYCCSWLVHEQPCFLCFESAEALDSHIKTDHAGKDGTYRCLWQSCSKHNTSAQTAGPMNFGNKPKLMRHVHSHTGYKPFPCPFPGCGKGFVTKEQLKNHETTHTKARKYACPLCEKAFAVKSALTTHITAVHEERKTHRCDLCGKAFADSSNLSKHKQTHYRPHFASAGVGDRRNGSSASSRSGVKKQRSRRTPSSATSTRSSPSVSTPTVEPASPALYGTGPLYQDFCLSSLHPVPMTRPAVPKFTAEHDPFGNIALMASYSVPRAPGSIRLSPAAGERQTGSDDLDASCYCCEQRCTPPIGPATPCDAPTEACDKDGFCDLPDCTPCCSDDGEHCDKEGFCDLPDCFVEPLAGPQNNDAASMPWEELFGGSSGSGDTLKLVADVQGPQRPLTQTNMDLGSQLIHMHGS